jgi:hypothetical protein
VTSHALVGGEGHGARIVRWRKSSGSGHDPPKMARIPVSDLATAPPGQEPAVKVAWRENAVSNGAGHHDRLLGPDQRCYLPPTT